MLIGRDMDRLKEMLVRHEGLKLKPYRDTVGKLTIGVGRNLDDRGISKEEAYWLLERDIVEAAIACEAHFDWFSDLTEPRQDVVVSMVFNLGLAGFKKFRKMIEAIKANKWSRAADEMLDSTWAKQVGKRANDLADIMRTGTY